MIRRWILATAALFSVAVSSVFGAEFDAAALAKLKGVLEAAVADKTVSGAVAVIGSSRGIAVIESAGAQTLEPMRPMTQDAIFRIASMTKPITAIGILQLQEQGKLSVTDPVEKYLPEFQNQMLAVREKDAPVTLKKPARPITLRDLLTHTSGLPGGYPAGYGNLYFSRTLTLKEAILLQSQRPLDFEPGSKWSYCNAGIDTLGRVIEVVAGMSYEDYLAAHIFQPLSMADTTPFVRPDQRIRLAGLYEQKEGVLREPAQSLIGVAADARHPIPAGGLVSTAADLARLYTCLLNGGELNGRRILKADTLKEMTTPQTGDLTTGFVDGMSFGYGFAVVKEPKGATAGLSAGTFGHGGAFGTQGWIDPHQDLFVVLMIQRVGLPNADNSDVRKAVQEVAINALKK